MFTPEQQAALDEINRITDEAVNALDSGISRVIALTAAGAILLALADALEPLVEQPKSAAFEDSTQEEMDILQHFIDNKRDRLTTSH